MNTLTKRAFCCAIAASGALLAACTGSPPPTAPTTSSSSAIALPSTPPAPNPVAEAPAPAPAESSAPVIDPNGYGRLKLGMTFAEVKRAGHVRDGDEPSQSCHQYELYSGDRRDGFVYITGTRGVEAIAPQRRVRTPDGVAVGWTADRVKSVYSELDLKRLEHLGRATIDTPGNAAANYRLGFGRDDRLADISLQMDDQPCYE